MCVQQNPALRLADVLQEFVSGMARTIHKGNEIIVAQHGRAADGGFRGKRECCGQRRCRKWWSKSTAISANRSKNSSAVNSQAAKQHCNRHNKPASSILSSRAAARNIDTARLHGI